MTQSILVLEARMSSVCICVCVCVCVCVEGGIAERRYLVDIHWCWKVLFAMTEMIF